MRVTPAATQHDQDTSYRLKRRVTLVGVVVNLLLAAGKIVLGVIGRSQALIVDGVHSLSDLVSDALVLAAARSASRGADQEHPYGHGRIETAATMGIGVLLLLVAAGFVYDAAMRLMNPEDLWVPGWVALAAAVASVASKEWLYQYTVGVARRLRSRLLEANAWHHRSDALSSVVVVVGVIGAIAGYAWFDALAAIVVAAMVGVIGWKFIWQAVHELVDTGADPRQLAELRSAIKSVHGVRSLHDLRTRLMGGELLVDVHIVVDSAVSASEGHRIADEVRSRLLDRDKAADVLVHVDADQSLDNEDERHPPLRDRVLADLRRVWAQIPEAAATQRTTLHYRGEQVDVELVLPPDRVAPEALPQLRARLEQAAAPLGYVGRVYPLIGTLGSGV
ncbi:MAG TPA: cation diffusion facilitator family transporter [Burkholderiaceae bacterium]|nr:cation diffusion facilitator family transporter [Burkholderiaceae bacterium]